MKELPALIVYTTYRLQSHNVEAFRLLASNLGKAATARDGCSFLDVTQDVGDPSVFRMIEG